MTRTAHVYQKYMFYAIWALICDTYIKTCGNFASLDSIIVLVSFWQQLMKMIWLVENFM